MKVFLIKKLVYNHLVINVTQVHSSVLALIKQDVVQTVKEGSEEQPLCGAESENKL